MCYHNFSDVADFVLTRVWLNRKKCFRKILIQIALRLEQVELSNMNCATKSETHMLYHCQQRIKLLKQIIKLHE